MVTLTLLQPTAGKIPLAPVSYSTTYTQKLMAHAHVRFHFWGSEIEAKPPEVEYESVIESDEGVALWTAKIV